jgi:hypothetical protein
MLLADRARLLDFGEQRIPDSNTHNLTLSCVVASHEWRDLPGAVYTTAQAEPKHERERENSKNCTQNRNDEGATRATTTIGHGTNLQ